MGTPMGTRCLSSGAASAAAGVLSPEYQAFELIGEKEVLVAASVGPYESIGGDIKFLRLKQVAVGGLVTDGSVRDTDELIGYGFPTFSYSTTPKQGPAAMQPWECNGVISCGGVAVRLARTISWSIEKRFSSFVRLRDELAPLARQRPGARVLARRHARSLVRSHVCRHARTLARSHECTHACPLARALACLLVCSMF